MENDYIWAVSADGIPWRIPATEDPNCSSEVEWEALPCPTSLIQTIVSNSKNAFAIDRSGKILLLVLPTHIALREKIEIYFNQRWYPIIGWKRPLPTDRSKYSDETGEHSKDMTSFEVSPGWSWEEPWTTHLDNRMLDSEGWQYSFSFMGAKWDKKCKTTNLVRRKILKRHMRYTSQDQWVELSNDSETFTELAIGGSEIMKNGEILLFALGTDGKIYRREGIRTNSPNGNSWISIPKVAVNGIEVDDVTLITMSPKLATLLCITWDGKMFYRKGISRNVMCGLTWHSIPTPQNKPVVGASIGRKTMWCITADGNVWWTRIEIDSKHNQHLMEDIKPESYFLVTHGGICRISVNMHDQVLAVSSSNERLKIRTGICESERTGKRFELLIDRADPKDQRWISLYAGSSKWSKVPEYFLNDGVLRARMEMTAFKKAKWRLAILKSIEQANEKSWKIMNDVKTEDLDIDNETEDGDEKKIIKKVRCQMKFDETYESVTLTIYHQFLEIHHETKMQKKIDAADILGAYPMFMRYPQRYLLALAAKKETNFLCFGFTDETAMNIIKMAIEDVIREQIVLTTRSSNGESMWAITTQNNVRWFCLSEMNKQFESLVPVGECKSLEIEGHFDSIDCGAKRIVWAINSAGGIYSLDTKFDTLSSLEQHCEYKQVDEVTLEMTEYQKHAIFRGFITFQGTQKGISAWMCNGEPVPQQFSSLPSKNWNWVDNEWKLKNEEWEYAQDIDGKYEKNESGQGKARKRNWIRRAKYETNRSAWKSIVGPKVKLVRVAKKADNNGKVAVIALTQDGHILMRNGVDRQYFVGDNWTEIVNDYPVESIHLQMNEKIWCITKDAHIMHVTIENDGNVEKCWKYLDMNLTSLTTTLSEHWSKGINITGSSNILYIRVNSILFRIDTINDTFSDPYVMGNLQEAITNSKGYIILRGTNVTIVKEWMVAKYETGNQTIISMKKVDRALNLGKLLKCISVF